MTLALDVYYVWGCSSKTFALLSKPKTDQSGRDRLYLTSKGEYTDTGKQFREQGKS